MQALPRYRRWQLWAMEKNPVNIEQVLTSISDRQRLRQTRRRRWLDDL